MKNYLLDTNIFMANPQCIDDFLDASENGVIVYEGVLDELDHLKNDSIKGHLARAAITEILKHIEEKNIIVMLKEALDIHQPVDDALVKIADDFGFILVSRDKTVHIKGLIAEIDIQDYESIKIKELPKWEECTRYNIVNNSLFIGEEPVKIPKEVFSISAKDANQKAALAALLNPEIPLVILSGQAGTGKNLLAIAAGIELILNNGPYNKLYVARAPVSDSFDIGYLPGNMEEKLLPWLRGVTDNMSFILGNSDSAYVEEFKDKFIEMLSIAHIKGASISNGYIIIDECQDLHKSHLKNLITRAGENTKVVLLGDPTQVSNTNLSEDFNGLVYVIDKLSRSELCEYIQLKEIYRSPLAKLGALYL